MQVFKRVCSVCLIALVLVMSVTLLLPTTQAASNPYPTSQDADGNGVTEIPCTYYAWQQTYDRLGIALPSWGDAINWYYNAPGSGYSVGTTARANSIAVWTISGHNWGHVAFVTSVAGDYMYVNEGGRTDLPGSNGIKDGQYLPATVGTTWYGRTLVGFVYLEGSGTSITFSDITQGTYFLKNKSNDEYLSVSYATDAQGQNVNTWVFNGYVEEQMEIIPATSGYKIRPKCCTSRVINANGFSVTPGLNVDIWDDVNDGTQWWGFEAVSGGYIIRNMQNQNCVMAVGADGRNVVVESYTGNNNQIWTLHPKNIKITYDANGGSGAPSTDTVAYGDSTSLSMTWPTRTGYTFLGWSTSSTATSASYTGSFFTKYSFSQDVTLYAVWKAKTYTISYNANGGSGAPDDQTKTYGVNLTLSNTTPTRTGYTFQGWATSSSATSASYQSGGSFSTNANTTLYAVWKAKTYTISYNANGGSGAPSSQTKTYGVNLILSNTIPTRTGYTFQGWATSSSATSASYQPGASFSTNKNTTLYAVWEEVQNGWVSEGGKWHYYKDGAKATGWLQDGGYWYYFNNSGVMQTGWQKIGGYWYFFHSGGKMATGWLQSGSTWYYLHSGGKMATGWAQVSGKWYYFNGSGAMLTGWQKISNVWYYFAGGGAMQTGWQKISNVWYYFQGSGAMQTGWLKLGSTWYYFHGSGAMATGSVTFGPKTYYFSASGACLNP